MKILYIVCVTLYVNTMFSQYIEDFEHWDSTWNHPYQTELENLYQVPDPKSGSLQHWSPKNNLSTCRTTDSYSGEYAMVVHNWYNHVHGLAIYEDSINFIPQYIQGMYKYRPYELEVSIEATIEVFLMVKSDSLIDTLGHGSLTIGTRTDEYMAFQIEVEYEVLTNVIPNYISIQVSNSSSDCAQSSVCHLLYIDDLRYSNIGIGNQSIERSFFECFPNPAQGRVVIESKERMQNLKLYDMQGRILLNQQCTGNNANINVSNYSPGTYIIEVQDENLTNSSQLIRVK